MDWTKLSVGDIVERLPDDLKLEFMYFLSAFQPGHHLSTAEKVDFIDNFTLPGGYYPQGRLQGYSCLDALAHGAYLFSHHTRWMLSTLQSPIPRVLRKYFPCPYETYLKKLVEELSDLEKLMYDLN